MVGSADSSVAAMESVEAALGPGGDIGRLPGVIRSALRAEAVGAMLEVGGGNQASRLHGPVESTDGDAIHDRGVAFGKVLQREFLFGGDGFSERD